MKYVRIIFCILAIEILAATPVLGQICWERTYGGDGSDGGLSIDQTSDGGYIVVGSTVSYGAGMNDVYLIKLDAYGDTIWTKTFGGTSNDAGYSVQQTADNGYIIVGHTNSFGAGLWDFYAIKTDPQGETLWTRTYGGMYHEFGRSAQQTFDGGYMFAGYTLSFGLGDTAAYLVKTDASGDTIWTRSYLSINQDHNFTCESAMQTSDSGYVMAGYNRPHPLVLPDFHVIKTDINGDTVWSRSYGPATSEDYAHSIQQTSDGGYIIAGSTSSNPVVNTDVYLVKTNASGDSVWAKTYDHCYLWDYGISVRQTSDGGYIVTGHAWPSATATDYDVYLIRTDADGDTLWTKIFGGADEDVGWSVRSTVDSGYVVAGWTESFGLGPRDVYVIKIDADGSAVTEQDHAMHNATITLSVKPNPFRIFTSVRGHESERFIVRDISGRQIDACPGNRIGEGLANGVYFITPENHNAKPVSIVKIR